MGRPRKQDADWFKHDKDMRDDPKVKALRHKFGLEGYAVYVMTIEIMADSDGFFTTENPLQDELSAGDMELSVGKLQEIRDYCVHLGLFEREPLTDNRCRKLTSKRLSRDMQVLIDARNSDRESIRRRKPKIKGFSAPKVHRGEERRGEETREEEEEIPPSPSAPQEEPQEKAPTLGDALRRINPRLFATPQELDEAAGIEAVYGREKTVATYRLWYRVKRADPFAWFIRYFPEWVKKLPAEKEPTPVRSFEELMANSDEVDELACAQAKKAAGLPLTEEQEALLHEADAEAAPNVEHAKDIFPESAPVAEPKIDPDIF